MPSSNPDQRESIEALGARLRRRRSATSLMLVSLSRSHEYYGHSWPMPTTTRRVSALCSLAQGFFNRQDDENSDLLSPTGPEDDAEVLNAVCGFVGRVDLTIEI